jgi:hypothetical protein
LLNFLYLPKPSTNFGGWRPNGFSAALADGSVRFISDTIDDTGAIVSKRYEQ